MPRSSFGPYGWPSAATNRRSALRGSTAMCGNLLCVVQAKRASRSCPRRSICKRRRQWTRSGRCSAFSAADVDDRSHRMARRRSCRSSRSADRRRSASTCVRHRWSSRRRHYTRPYRTCRDGSDAPPPRECGWRGAARSIASASRRRATGSPARSPVPGSRGSRLLRSVRLQPDRRDRGSRVVARRSQSRRQQPCNGEDDVMDTHGGSIARRRRGPLLVARAACTAARRDTQPRATNHGSREPPSDPPEGRDKSHPFPLTRHTTVNLQSASYLTLSGGRHDC